MDWMINIGVPIWSAAPGDAVAVNFNARGVYPLRVLKQSVSMLMSVGSSKFAQENKWVARFLRDPESHEFPGDFKVGMFLFKGTLQRNVGFGGQFNIFTGENRVISEITSRPFGFTFHVFGHPLQNQLYIEDRKHYLYRDCVDLNVVVPILRGNSPYPGLYHDLADA